jgi:hypothetical protein
MNLLSTGNTCRGLVAYGFLSFTSFYGFDAEDQQSIVQAIQTWSQITPIHAQHE